MLYRSQRAPRLCYYAYLYVYTPRKVAKRRTAPLCGARRATTERLGRKGTWLPDWGKCAGIGFGCGSVFVGASPSWLAKAMEVNRNNSSKSATTSQQQPIMMDFIRESFTLCLHLSNKEAFMDIMIVAIIQFLHPLWRREDLSGFCFCLVSRVVS